MEQPEVTENQAIPPDALDDEEISEFLAGIGKEANRVKVYYQDPDQGFEDFYLFGCDPKTLTEDLIRRKQPKGGKFRLKIYNGSFYVGCRTWNIAPDLSDVSRKESNESSGKNQENSNHSAEITLLREQVNRQHELVTKMMESLSQRQAGPGMTEMMAIVEKVSSMVPKQPDISALIVPVMGLFGKVIEMGKDIGSGGAESWKDRLVTLGMNTIEKLPLLLQQIGAARGGDEMIAGNGMSEGAALMALKEGIKQLKKKALAGKDPRLWVDVIADNFDDPQYQALALALANSTFEDFGRLDPEILQEPLKSWFRTLYDGLREVINANHDSIAGEPGISSDIAGNEAVDGRSNSKPDTAPAGSGDNQKKQRK